MPRRRLRPTLLRAGARWCCRSCELHQLVALMACHSYAMDLACPGAGASWCRRARPRSRGPPTAGQRLAARVSAARRACTRRRRQCHLAGRRQPSAESRLHAAAVRGRWRGCCCEQARAAPPALQARRRGDAGTAESVERLEAFFGQPQPAAAGGCTTKRVWVLLAVCSRLSGARDPQCCAAMPSHTAVHPDLRHETMLFTHTHPCWRRGGAGGGTAAA